MRFIFPSLLLLPFFVRSAIVCNIVDDGSVVEIRCYEDGTPSDPSSTNAVMTKQACEDLKTNAVSHLQHTYDLLESLHTNCLEALDYLQVSQDDANYVSGLVLDNSQQYTNDVYYSELAYLMSEMPSRITYAKEKLEDVDAQLLSARPPIQQAILEIDSYPCASGTCSGGESGGTMGCPCAVEFSEQLKVLQGIQTNIASVYAELVSVRVLQLSIQQAVTNIDEWVTAIGKRLDAPDDRMFGELQELYTRYFTNVTNIARGALKLQDVMYDLKLLIRGESSQNPTPLKLSSEGVIGLHQLAFDMANFSANQAQFDQLNILLSGFTNQVMHYFNEFSIMRLYKQIVPPTEMAQSAVYNAFTNDTVDPFTRYRNMVRSSGGGVTNWFQRMELYQQAQLGWFDQKIGFSPSDNQEQNTESSLEHQVMQTTNDLGRVNTEATNLVLSVESFVTPVFQDFSRVEITASLPTLVTLFPEIDVPAFHTSFGPIVWDTTDAAEMIEFARSVTTLVWRCSFWVMCVLLGVGISRVCMILVMYVIHIVKNL